MKIPIEWGCRFHSIRQQDGTNHRVLSPPQPHPLVFVTSSSSILTLQLDARKKRSDDRMGVVGSCFLPFVCFVTFYDNNSKSITFPKGFKGLWSDLNDRVSFLVLPPNGHQKKVLCLQLNNANKIMSLLLTDRFLGTIAAITQYLRAAVPILSRCRDCRKC